MFVVAEAEAGRFGGEYGLAHVIHHQSTEGTFLLVGGRRGRNELWLTVYARPPPGTDAPVRTGNRGVLPSGRLRVGTDGGLART